MFVYTYIYICVYVYFLMATPESHLLVHEFLRHEIGCISNDLPWGNTARRIAVMLKKPLSQ